MITRDDNENPVWTAIFFPLPPQRGGSGDQMKLPLCSSGQTCFHQFSAAFGIFQYPKFWGDQWFTLFLQPANRSHSDRGFEVTWAVVQSQSCFNLSLPFQFKLLSKGAINYSGWSYFLSSSLPQMKDKANISQQDNGIWALCLLSCCKRMIKFWSETVWQDTSSWPVMVLIFTL